MKSLLRTSLIILALAALLSIGTIAMADPGPFLNPDGALCTFTGNDDGPYGPRGVYDCVGGNDGDYTGYGPPDLDLIL
ncbi:MAG: hypothetical protein AAGD01_05140 [Acidobacteriota bacterium]